MAELVSNSRDLDNQVLLKLKAMPKDELLGLAREAIEEGYDGEEQSILVDVLYGYFGVELAVYHEDDFSSYGSVLFLEKIADSEYFRSSCPSLVTDYPQP